MLLIDGLYQVFPKIYNWVTFGICSLLQVIARQEFDIIKKGKQVLPYILEFTSALERTLAYAHTGNVKVLSSGVMKPLFLARAMVELGMPTILKGVYELPFQGATSFTVAAHTWPLTANKQGPATCSKASHIYNYGEDHYMVSERICWNEELEKLNNDRHMKQSFESSMHYTCQTINLATRYQMQQCDNVW